jgi:hypothetical protein
MGYGWRESMREDFEKIKGRGGFVGNRVNTILYVRAGNRSALAH